MTTKTRSKNTALWDRVSKTDPDMAKRVSNGGHSFTSIDAQYQIQCATAEWGPYGSTWGLRNTNIDLTMLEVNGLAMLHGEFYYPQGAWPFHNAIKVAYTTKTGKHILDDDFAKKIETDSLTKSLSKLGFNADIFLGRFDDARYVQELRDEKAQRAQADYLLDEDQIAQLQNEIEQRGYTVQQACQAWNIDSLAQIPKSGFDGYITNVQSWAAVQK